MTPVLNEDLHELSQNDIREGLINVRSGTLAFYGGGLKQLSVTLPDGSVWPTSVYIEDGKPRFLKELRSPLKRFYKAVSAKAGDQMLVQRLSDVDYRLQFAPKAAYARDDQREEEERDEHENGIKGRTDIGPKEKSQLVMARRGQGIFKSNVLLNEKACRLTGITIPAHLRASHIKAWKSSSDDEKLDGCNGLLLAPHVDHLFDRGLISFRDNGDLWVSPLLDSSILRAWGLPDRVNVGLFNSKQREFLDYHRQEAAKKAKGP